MALDIPSPEVVDYYRSRSEAYKVRLGELRAHYEDPDSVEQVVQLMDNVFQDILLMLMEDNIVTTQVRLDPFYNSISGYTSSFRDFLENQRFLVAIMRKDFKAY